MPTLTVNLRALGLNTQPNALEAPSGSMSVASNVVIRRGDVIEPVRGFALYGTSPGQTTTQLSQYRNTVLQFYGSKVAYDSDNAGTWVEFSGNFSPVTNDLRIKSTVSNGNYYFTTDNGIYKISAKSASEFTNTAGYITKAGAQAALDLQGTLNITLGATDGFLPQDAAVSYKVVWGYKDVNGNLVLGAPSSLIQMYNPLQSLIIQDLNNLASALDLINYGACLVTDGTYVQNCALTINDDASDININISVLAVQLDKDIEYAKVGGGDSLAISTATQSGNTVTINFSSGDPRNYLEIGSNIYLGGTVGFTPDTSGTLNGPQVVTGVSATTITLISDTSNVDPALVPIASISAANPSAVVTKSVHGLSTGNAIVITGSNSTPNIDGTWIVTVLDTTTFTIPTPVTTAGTSGAVQAFSGSTITVDADAIIRSFEYETVVDANSTIIDTPVTNDELLALQSQVQGIIDRLKIELVAIIPAANSTTFITPLTKTTSANVDITLTIPEDTGSEYFFQVYRSQYVEATGATSISQISPNAELQLVYEAYPTSTELSAGVVTFTDITPQSFLGAFLYTNQASGLGAVAANAVPPLAKDINRFKNVTFYANTSRKYNIFENLLGVQNIIDAGGSHSITIANDTFSNTYDLVLGIYQNETIQTIGDTANSLNGDWFDKYSAQDETRYVFYYKTSGGSDSPPTIPGASIIQIPIQTGATNNTVASLTCGIINLLGLDFSATYSGDVITVTNINYGASTAADNGTQSPGFTFNVSTTGAGEDVATQKVLLSINFSVGTTFDETARSLVRVINRDPAGIVYAFYTSSISGIPGEMYFEARDFSTNKFYFLASDSITGASFSPDISPSTSRTITGISVADPTHLTISGAHGLVNGDQIFISGSDSTPSINGIYPVITIDTTHVTIDVNVSSGGGGLANYRVLTDTLLQNSDNSVKINRVFYSQYLQPDAVPILNYLDVGASDKAILRIFPLRDSLFVFKEDGLYRISGEVAPFNLALFDGNCNLLAADSVDIVNNQIIAYTNQGIYSITESGAQDISQPIKETLLAAVICTTFPTSTWGVGYNSDSAFYMFTTLNIDDPVATVCYRYSTLTNTWTTLDRANTCGVNFQTDDKLYMGAGDVAYVEKERKNLDRTDYANREYTDSIVTQTFNENSTTMQLSDVSNYSIGDVVTQSQLLSIYQYNSLLLKLDQDPIAPIYNATGWYANLAAIMGDNMRTKVLELASALDTVMTSTNYAASVATFTGISGSNDVGSPTEFSATMSSPGILSGRYVKFVSSTSLPILDPDVLYPTHFISYGGGVGVFTVPVAVTTAGTATFTTQDSTFEDIAGCFNIITQKLNLDSSTKFKNYTTVNTDTSQEAVIIEIDRIHNKLYLNVALDWIQGPVTIYEAIPMEVIFTPNSMQDPVNLKHLSEATIMFADKTFTSATLSFSTDLLPEFMDIDFNGDGSGLMGNKPFGQGFFGGAGNSAPLRTYIPRQCQRCRYIVLRFTHAVAREKISIYGISVTGNNTGSSRGYR